MGGNARNDLGTENATVVFSRKSSTNELLTAAAEVEAKKIVRRATYSRREELSCKIVNLTGKTCF